MNVKGIYRQSFKSGASLQAESLSCRQAVHVSFDTASTAAHPLPKYASYQNTTCRDVSKIPLRLGDNSSVSHFIPPSARDVFGELDGTLIAACSFVAKRCHLEKHMHVLGYTWTGIRTADLNSAERFFSEVLGFRTAEHGKSHVQFELPSGQLFEVFNSRSRYYQFHNCPVIGFQVEDVRAAKQEMEARGTEFVTEVFVDTSEAWAYFRGPDGYLYEIWHTDRPWKQIAASE